MSIKQLIINLARSRSPDVVVGGYESPYMLRWFLIPRNRVFNIYVHLFLRSDDDRARHTHPWLFNISWLLSNHYREWLGDRPHEFVDRRAGEFKFRWGKAAHRIELTNGACWTVFITGPRVRQWGFLCPQGWVHWKLFTAADDPGAIGKGCDQ